MKKTLLSLIVLLSAFVSNGISANPSEQSVKAYTVETVPNVYANDQRLYVSDPHWLLSSEVGLTINQLFDSLETKTGYRGTMVILPSIGEDKIGDFSENLFNYWTKDEKEKAYRFIVTFVEDKKLIRFYTNKEFEEVLTKVKIKRIQDQIAVTLALNEDINIGILDCSKFLCQRITEINKSIETSDNATNFFIIAIIVVAVFVVCMIFYLYRSQCSCCGEPELVVSKMRIRKDAHNKRHYTATYKCEACRESEIRDSTGIKAVVNIILDILYIIVRIIMIIAMIYSAAKSRGGRHGGGSSGGGGSSSSW